MMKEMKEATDRITNHRMRKNMMTMIDIAQMKVIQITHQSQSMCRPRHEPGNKKANHIARSKK